jgi:ribosomal protein S18 acetylase RimI-like enzyme
MSVAGLTLVSDTKIDLHEYARVPISFPVTERLDLVSADLPLIAATSPTRAVEPPYVKDYDAQPGQHPTEWPRRFDLANWWVAAAFLGEQRIGGAVVIPDASADTAVLWDIRVHPTFRTRGVGRALLSFAESHARARGQRRMQIETQDINVLACRFYASAGYVLTAIDPHAYPDLPDEVQLIWQKRLTAIG